MTTQDDYAESLKRSIDDWNARIKDVQRKMDEQSDQAQARYKEQVHELQRLRDKAELQMKEIQRSGQEQWSANAGKMKAAWDEISDGFERAWSRLR